MESVFKFIDVLPTSKQNSDPKQLSRNSGSSTKKSEVSFKMKMDPLLMTALKNSEKLK